MNLLTDIRNGDELAFRRLYETFKVKVFNYFLKRTGCVHDAEDLLQNTFLKIWKYRKSINENFLIEQHLFHVARTVFIDYTRRQNKVQRLTKMADQDLPAEFPMPEIYLENRSIQSILIKMPELRRKAFILNKIEGYSYKEIAQKLSVNVKSIDNNVARALKQIRKAMLMLFTFIC